MSQILDEITIFHFFLRILLLFSILYNSLKNFIKRTGHFLIQTIQSLILVVINTKERKKNHVKYYINLFAD